MGQVVDLAVMPSEVVERRLARSLMTILRSSIYRFRAIYLDLEDSSFFL